MAGILATVSKGIMDSVLAKLNELISDNFANLIRAPNDITFLKDELTAMKALLEKLDDNDVLDAQVKNWRDQFREMAYDIEDCIDDFTNNHNTQSADSRSGFLRRASHFLRAFRAHHEAAKQIKELKARLDQINERHKRYKVDIGNTSVPVTIDPRISAVYTEATSLVGVDGPKEELINQLVIGHQRQQLKVLSIVGFGGLGKTTLANAVYREVGAQFACKAFVSVSQKADFTSLLVALQSQVGLPRPSDACRLEDHINRLIQYLREKRYLIVVDDLWGVPDWNFISCAFPQNNQHSRVMITTRNGHVARACSSDHGCIYNMKPLCEQDSRRLLFNRLFRPEDDCTPQVIEVCCEILKKCGGLPLAIITIASLLACEGATTCLEKQWEYIQKSLAAQLPTNDPTLEGMMYILNLSYQSLPHHLRKCFQYIGAYPEDRQISKDELVRQWVAGGFVRKGEWDVAESYFNELVNRSMIQPVYLYNEVSHCKVHDMMLDVILRRYREDNFMSLLHGPRVVSSEAEYSAQYKVRRLSVNWRGVEDGRIPSTLRSRLSHVRCVTMFGISGAIPPPSEFKFLRVLFIECLRGNTRMDLTGISHLSLLRYIEVVEGDLWGVRVSIELPPQIRMLRHLETLELPAAAGGLSSCSVPSDIAELTCLSHLFLPAMEALPDAIGRVKSLRSLGGFCLIESSSQSIEGLGELTNMEELRIQTDKRYPRRPGWMAALGSSLRKLGKLKVLSMSSFSVNLCADALCSSWVNSSPFPNLEVLNMTSWTFSRVPRWMGDLCNLRRLSVGAMAIVQDDIDMIGTRLSSSLVELCLRIPGVPAERLEIGGSTGFQHLRFLQFDCDDGTSYLAFEAGAVPKLSKLWLAFNWHEWVGTTPAGLQRLSSLKEIVVHTPNSSGTASASAPEEMEDRRRKTALIESVFQEAARTLPSRPAFALHDGLWPRKIEVQEDGLEMPRIHH